MSRSLSPNKNTPDKDVVYTPPELAKRLVSMLDIRQNDFCFDPCKGDGAFYNGFPTEHKDWSELSLGRDFLHDNIILPKDRTTWCISNPPWSKHRDFCKRSYELGFDYVSFLVTVQHALGSKVRNKESLVQNYRPSQLVFLPTPKEFPQSGFQLCFITLKRNYEGDIKFKTIE